MNNELSWEDQQKQYKSKYKKNGERKRKEKSKDKEIKKNDKGQVYVEGFGRVNP